MLTNLEKLMDDQEFDEIRSDDSESSEQPHDMEIDVSSIKSLEEGWNVVKSPSYDELRRKCGLIVGVFGLANRGKTFLINLLMGTKLPSGFNKETKGICVKFSPLTEDNGSVGYLDCAGSDTPLEFYKDGANKNCSKEAFEKEKKDKFNDKKACEDLIQSFILENCKQVVVVVGQLTFADQSLIQTLEQYSNNKDIFIVHNFNFLTTVENVHTQIKKDIFDCFKIPRQYNLHDMNALIFDEELPTSTSTEEVIEGREIKIRKHLVLAQEGCKEVTSINEATIQYLRETFVTGKEVPDLVPKFEEYCKKQLFARYVQLPAESVKDKFPIGYDIEKSKFKLTSNLSIQLKMLKFTSWGQLKTGGDNEQYKPPIAIFQKDNQITILIEMPGNQFTKNEKGVYGITKGKIFYLIKSHNLKDLKFEYDSKNDQIRSDISMGNVMWKGNLPDIANKTISGTPTTFEYKDGILKLVYEMKPIM